jgi:DNA-binding NarL/FixJ family response regulator
MSAPQPNGDDPITVTIVADRQLFRDVLRPRINADPGLVVVADTGEAEAATTLVADHCPDVILVVAGATGEDLTDLVCRLRHASPPSRIVIISPHDKPCTIRRMMYLETCGYLLSETSLHEVLAVLRAARRDTRRMTLSVSRTSLRALYAPSSVQLSAVEQDVLRMVAQGERNADISAALNISENTIKRHLRSIYKKLGTSSRMDAVNKAVAADLISPNSQE